MNACVKQLRHLPALEVGCFRLLFSVVVSYVGLRRLGVAPFGQHYRLLINRSSTGALVCCFVGPAAAAAGHGCYPAIPGLVLAGVGLNA